MASTINASSSGSGGLISTGDASGVLQLQNNGTTALTVNGGYIGIGTGSPAKQINIEGSSSSTTTIGVGMLITNTNTTNDSRAGIAFANFDNYGAAIWSPRTSSTAGALVFGTNPETGTAETNIVEAGRFTKTGNFVLKGGSTSADGVGITFPSTQVASTNANCLDDYEEGTFTPVLRFGGGTTGITYGNQVGRYTKTGRIVTVQFNILLTNKGSSTGAATVSGFPFPGVNPGSRAFNAGVLVNESGGSGFPAGTYGLVWSDSIAYLRVNGGSSLTELTNSYFTNSTEIYFSSTFEVS
jgi:hypothetical protein